jgi:hypothetical protein
MQWGRQADVTSPCYAHHAKNAYKAAMNLCHWHYYFNRFKDKYYVQNCNTSFLTLTAGLNNTHSIIQVIFFLSLSSMLLLHRFNSSLLQAQKVIFFQNINMRTVLIKVPFMSRFHKASTFRIMIHPYIPCSKNSIWVSIRKFPSVNKRECHYTTESPK